MFISHWYIFVIKFNQITGDTAFLATTLSVMQTAAKAELVRNQSLSEQITDDGTTLLEKLSSHLCLNNCSSNGQCKNGMCAIFYICKVYLICV